MHHCVLFLESTTVQHAFFPLQHVYLPRKIKASLHVPRGSNYNAIQCWAVLLGISSHSQRSSYSTVTNHPDQVCTQMLRRIIRTCFPFRGNKHDTDAQRSTVQCFHFDGQRVEQLPSLHDTKHAHTTPFSAANSSRTIAKADACSYFPPLNQPYSMVS